MARFERYFKRKGWFGFGDEASLDPSSTQTDKEEKGNAKKLIMNWENSEGRYKLLADVALAWAITKALLPLRIVVSVWATPWFAGVLVRGQRIFTRK